MFIFAVFIKLGLRRLPHVEKQQFSFHDGKDGFNAHFSAALGSSKYYLVSKGNLKLAGAHSPKSGAAKGRRILFSLTFHSQRNTLPAKDSQYTGGCCA